MPCHLPRDELKPSQELLPDVSTRELAVASPSPPAFSSPVAFPLPTYMPQTLIEGLSYARQGSVWTQLHFLCRTLRSGHPSYLICQIGVSGNRASPSSDRSQSQERDSCLMVPLGMHSSYGQSQFDPVRSPGAGLSLVREPTGGVPISPCRPSTHCPGHAASASPPPGHRGPLAGRSGWRRRGVASVRRPPDAGTRPGHPVPEPAAARPGPARGGGASRPVPARARWPSCTVRGGARCAVVQ